MCQDLHKWFPFYRWLFGVQMAHGTVAHVAFLLVLGIFREIQHLDVCILCLEGDEWTDE